MRSPRILLYKGTQYLIYHGDRWWARAIWGRTQTVALGVPRPRSPTTSPYTGLHYQSEHLAP